jgi:glycerol-3-phosphate acyltransferase PlsX
VSASLAISLDAMGGDNAPEMVIRGADIARQRFPDAHFRSSATNSASSR